MRSAATSRGREIDQLYVGSAASARSDRAARRRDAAQSLPRCRRRCPSSPSIPRSRCCSTSCRGSSPRIRSSRHSTQTPTRELAERGVPHDPRPLGARRVGGRQASSASSAFVDRVRRGLDQVRRATSGRARGSPCVTSAGPIGVAVGLDVRLRPTHHMVRTSIVIRNASITELQVSHRKTSIGIPSACRSSRSTRPHHLPPELHTEY